MRRKLLVVLSLVLAVGCGSGGGGTIEITTQGQVQGCALDSVVLMLILADCAVEIIDDVKTGGTPDVVSTGDGIWSFTKDFSFLGIGDPDTRIVGTVTEPASDGGAYEFDSVVISSLGGPITGTADVDVRVVDEFASTVTGTINLNDTAAGCDIALNITEPFIIDNFERRTERQLAAVLFDVNVGGEFEFTFDFASTSVSGTATIEPDSQQVTLVTDSEFGTFDFDLLPNPRAFEGILECFDEFQDTAGDLIDAIDAVLAEAEGENHEFVEIDGQDFVYDDGTLSVNGTVSLIPPSVSFTFTHAEEGTSGGSDGPITFAIPIGAGLGSVNGTIDITGGGGFCIGTFQIIGAKFDTDAEEIEFVDGLTVMTVTTPSDTMQVQIDWGAEGEAPVEGLDLTGVSVLINGTPMPPVLVLIITLFFGLNDDI